MSKTVGHWAGGHSHGCFVYLERELGETPGACRALLEAAIEGLGIEDAKISTRNYFLQWSRFEWKKVDAALAGGRFSLSLLVGTPQEVRLGASLALRLDPAFVREQKAPPALWLVAESATWPASTFVPFARTWLRIAAERCRVLSGGVLAAANLRDAKVEASLEYESVYGEAPTEFAAWIRKEPHAFHAWEKLRRMYPITLLGPKLARHTSPQQLREAGAVAIDCVNESLIVEATSEVVEAWSPAYLEQTRELRRLVWPWSMQHPADDPTRRARR